MGLAITDQSGDIPDLLRRAAAGDQPACDPLFDRYCDRLKRMPHLRLSRGCRAGSMTPTCFRRRTLRSEIE